jgi:hypothetical protein
VKVLARFRPTPSRAASSDSRAATVSDFAISGSSVMFGKTSFAFDHVLYVRVCASKRRRRSPAVACVPGARIVTAALVDTVCVVACRGPDVEQSEVHALVGVAAVDDVLHGYNSASRRVDVACCDPPSTPT